MNDKTVYQTYIEEICKYPLLTKEQELELSQKSHAGDSAAQLRLVQCNLRLVVSIGSKYVNPDFPIMDVIQEGNMGLLTAAGKFHYSHNTRFSTYACWWISQSITRALNNKKRLVRIPHRKEELLKRIKQAENVLSQKLARSVTAQELSAFTGVPSGEIVQLLASADSVLSMDAQIDPAATQTLADVVPDETYSPDNTVLEDSMRQYVHSLLDHLPSAERQVIWYRYNLGHEEKAYTLRQISEIMGLSAETIRQMEIRAIKRLKDLRFDMDICYA
ncbi:MAG: RNA polymerase sigma factor RpoD/SigA [Spirochaetaceae bacterium]|jgi:RNA polymerase primary sigma factor|nr:RNA polymerase sigma factor RpoD/SigA [Spirochaetaceae bacterium]